MSNINKTLWDKFVNYLKSSSPNTICEWNHHRELILRDDRSIRCSQRDTAWSFSERLLTTTAMYNIIYN